jgi:hypothetical protein
MTRNVVRLPPGRRALPRQPKFQDLVCRDSPPERTGFEPCVPQATYPGLHPAHGISVVAPARATLPASTSAFESALP